MNDFELLYNYSLQGKKLSGKQQRVLEASLYLFSEKGFENTTSIDIAREAKVSEGTVFSRFKTKEGILEAIIEVFFDEIIPEMLADFSKKRLETDYNNLSDFIYAIFHDRLLFMKRNIKPIKVILSRALIDPALSERIARTVQELITRPLEPILNEFKGRGMMIDWPNSRIVRYMISLTLSYVCPSMVMDDVMLNEEVATAELVELLTRALAA